MVQYIIRRVLWGVVLVLAVIAITFLLFYLLPNVNPAVLRAGRNSNPKIIAEIAHDLGTDKPIYTQFWHYLDRLVFHLDLGFSYYSGASVKSLILDRLPAATSAAVYARLLRGSLIDVMGEDYIRTARAKGLPERRVVMKHGVRSAITPLVTVLGLDVAILLGGAVLVETVFDIPGIGRLNYDAITHGDFPIIQGTIVLAAIFIIVANIVVDIAYAYLDPRVRHT